MKARNVLNRIYGQRLLLAVALYCVSLSVSATWVNRATGQGIWNAAVNGQTTRLGVGPGQMVVIKPPTTGTGWTTAGNYGVAAGAGGGVKVGGSGTIAVGERAVPVNISGELGKQAVVGGLMGCLTGGVVGCAIGVATPLAAAWMLSADTRINETTKQLEKKTGGGNAVQFQPPGTSGWYGTKEAAAGAFIQAQVAQGSSYEWRWLSHEESGANFERYANNVYQDTVYIPFATRDVPQGGTWNPATPQEVRDKLIAAGPPFPGIVPELADTGVDWNKIWPGFADGTTLGSPTITGPATILGPKETTTNPDGSKTTKQSSTPMTYRSGEVTAGSTTTSTTTVNSDGTPRSTTSTVTAPGNEGDKPKEEAVTQCDKYPNSLGCAELDTPEGEIPRQNKEVSWTAEDVFGTGACPIDQSITLGTLGQTVKVTNWAQICDWSIPLRFIVLALASFAAFLIVMPGETRT